MIYSNAMQKSCPNNTITNMDIWYFNARANIIYMAAFRIGSNTVNTNTSAILQARLPGMIHSEPYYRSATASAFTFISGDEDSNISFDIFHNFGVTGTISASINIFAFSISSEYVKANL